MEKISLFLKQFGVLVLSGGVGLGLLLYGLGSQLLPEETTVEIVKGAGSASDEQLMVVDVAGAVEKPGLYKLPPGSRIGEALVSAGGLAGAADREWVAKNINLAEVLKDGAKVYIPMVNEQTIESQSDGASGKVNVNTASLVELEGLEGIGPVRAAAIIENRPYKSMEELASKAGVSQGMLDKIKDQLSVY